MAYVPYVNLSYTYFARNFVTVNTVGNVLYRYYIHCVILYFTLYHSAPFITNGKRSIRWPSGVGDGSRPPRMFI